MPAESITQTQTVAHSATDWDTTLGFQQFDPNLGSLQAVGLSLTGDVGGSVSIENLQPDAATSSVSIYGVVEASIPDAGVAVAATPAPDAVSETLGAYNGTIGFAGTSGTVISGLTQVATGTVLQTISTDPGLFVGTGTVPVTVQGQAFVDESGPANLEMLSQATAGAQVTLDYQYSPPEAGGDGGSGGSVIQLAPPSGWGAPLSDQSVATAPQTFVVPDTITDWSASLPALQFDPSLGMLEAVAIEMNGDLNTGVSIENLGGGIGDYDIGQAGSIILTLPGATEEITPYLTNDLSGSLGAFDGTIDFAGSSGLSESGVISTDSLDDALSDAADLSAFSGTGTIDLSLSSSGTANVEVPGNSLLQLGGSTGATIELSYIYIPTGTVPDDGGLIYGGFTADELPETGTGISQDIVADVACFVRGTRIATEQGERAIEALSIGEHVLLAEGGSAPIVWLGRRRVDCRRHPRPATVRPVRIEAHAFGRNLPARDLLLSPDHAIYAEGVLIPVKHLLNGYSIRQEPSDRVEYWHLELPRHAAILAERLPAESLLDTGAKTAFEGGACALQLHPDFSIRLWEAAGFAPLMVVGAEVERVRRRLAWNGARRKRRHA